MRQKIADVKLNMLNWYMGSPLEVQELMTCSIHRVHDLKTVPASCCLLIYRQSMLHHQSKECQRTDEATIKALKKLYHN